MGESVTGSLGYPVTPGVTSNTRAQGEHSEPHARKGVTRGNQGSGLALAIPEELVEALAQRVADLLAERQPQAAPELLTVDEVAAFLRCRRQRVYDLVSQGRLPHLKDGARLLLRRSDLLAYLSPEERAA